MDRRSRSFMRFLKTRVSCQPDQAIEPRAISNLRIVPSEDTSESEASSANQSNVFVPLKQSEKATGMIEFVKL